MRNTDSSVMSSSARAANVNLGSFEASRRKARAVYERNIQIAELNALCAVIAIIKWKKYCGFYQDLEGEHDSTYSTNIHLLTGEDCA
jgi:hypothetical protein